MPKWATGIIEQFTIKGFAMDDERLKNDDSNPRLKRIFSGDEREEFSVVKQCLTTAAD